MKRPPERVARRGQSSGFGAHYPENETSLRRSSGAQNQGRSRAHYPDNETSLRRWCDTTAQRPGSALDEVLHRRGRVLLTEPIPGRPARLAKALGGRWSSAAADATFEDVPPAGSLQHVPGWANLELRPVRRAPLAQSRPASPRCPRAPDASSVVLDSWVPLVEVQELRFVQLLRRLDASGLGLEAERIQVPAVLLQPTCTGPVRRLPFPVSRLPFPPSLVDFFAELLPLGVGHPQPVVELLVANEGVLGLDRAEMRPFAVSLRGAHSRSPGASRLYASCARSSAAEDP